MKRKIGLSVGLIFFTALCFGLIGCDNGTTSEVMNTGVLTINGLESNNGKYVYAMAGLSAEGSFLIAAVNANLMTESATLGLISEGSTALKVWKVTENYKQTGFNETGTFVFNVVRFSDIAKPSSSNDYSEQGKITATFTNGIGSGIYSVN